jgi:hypothetical protein
MSVLHLYKLSEFLGLTAVGSWCQRWNIKINEGKTQANYFSKRRRMPGDELQLNGRNIPFVNSVKYLGVIFDRRMTWRLHIEKIAPKAFGHVHQDIFYIQK